MLKKIATLTIFALALVLAGGLLAQGTDPGTDNIIHAWTFDDDTADDQVGDAEGTPVGDVLIGDGKALFWELGQYIELPGETIALMIYEGLTISAWFIPQELANTNFHMLWFFGDMNDQGFGSNSWFYAPARGDDKSRTAISSDNLSEPWMGEDGADGPEVDDGLLHHAVCTIDYSFITYYLDGVFQAEAPVGTTSPNNYISSISTQFSAIAKGGYASDPTWLGEVDEIIIYDRVLSADEATYLYNNPPGGTPVENSASIVKEFGLSQNYPNPFNPTTNISFALAKNAMVNLTVYDVLGNEVVTLVDGFTNAGQHNVMFDGSNLSSGTYIYKININGEVQTKRMLLMK